MARLRRWGVTGLLAAVALACASDVPEERSVLLSGAERTWLVLPLNVTAILSPELEARSAVVWDELTAYLQDQGKPLKTVNFRDARRMWLASIRKVRSSEQPGDAGFEEAAQAFVAELGRHAEFSTVLSPSLFVRQAVIEGRKASWDGVSRGIEIEAEGIEAKRIAQETALEGVAPAVSLHVVMLDAEGKKLHEALRGLELLVRVRVRGSPDLSPEERIEFAPRPKLFEDRRELREEIKAVLAAAPGLPER